MLKKTIENEKNGKKYIFFHFFVAKSKMLCYNKPHSRGVNIVIDKLQTFDITIKMQEKLRGYSDGENPIAFFDAMLGEYIAEKIAELDKPNLVISDMSTEDRFNFLCLMIGKEEDINRIVEPFIIYLVDVILTSDGSEEIKGWRKTLDDDNSIIHYSRKHTPKLNDGLTSVRIIDIPDGAILRINYKHEIVSTKEIFLKLYKEFKDYYTNHKTFTKNN